MGLFSKPKTRHLAGGVGPSNAGASETVGHDEIASLPSQPVDIETEHVRSQLSKLFSTQQKGGDGSSERERRERRSLGNLQNQADSQRDDRSSPRRGRSSLGRLSEVAHQNMAKLPTLSVAIEALEAQNVEELTPISGVSPGGNVFPDTCKSGGADLGLWSSTSPQKSSPSSHGNSQGNPLKGGSSSTSSSPVGRRLVQMSRTNSFSTMTRLARRASVKRKHSLAKSTPSCPGSTSDLVSLENTCLAENRFPSLSSSPSSPSTMAKSQHQSGFSELSASPTTPHLGAEESATELPMVIPVISSADYFESNSSVSNSCGPTSGQGKRKSSRKFGEAMESPRNVSQEASTDLIVAEPAGTAGIISSPELQKRGGWDKLELEEFGDADVYGLEAATAREFVLATNDWEQLNNTPNSGVGDLPFADGSNSSGTGSGERRSCDTQPNSLLPPKHKMRDDAPIRVEIESPGAQHSKIAITGAGGKLFGGGNQKSKPKARKRPPPLLTPEPKSDGGTGSPSASTRVFGSNGDFTTGGFRITAEGMVGKPEKLTRMDSDDAPTTGCIPETVRDLSLVRSLADFRKGPTLGTGAAGRVYLTIHEPSGKSMAMKVVNVYDEAKRNQLLKELDTLSSHVSRFLVRFYGAFYDGKGAVHIALEYMEAGCLSTTIQKFGAIPEPVSRMIAVDALRALRFLHRHNVLHRDFKTANILLSRRSLCAKVSDFGLARDLDAGVSRVDTFVGTVAYMSPERLNGSKYTYASDIWALGISIVECLLGRYPFDRPQSYFDYLDSTKNTKGMLKGAGCSREAADFVSRCTETDPLRRPTAAQLMEHPWIANLKRDHTLFRHWLDGMESVNSQSTTSMRSMQSISAFLGNRK